MVRCIVFNQDLTVLLPQLIENGLKWQVIMDDVCHEKEDEHGVYAHAHERMPRVGLQAHCHEKEDGDEAEATRQDVNVAEVIVAKNRHGETGTVEFAFDGEHTLFLQLEKVHDD